MYATGKKNLVFIVNNKDLHAEIETKISVRLYPYQFTTFANLSPSISQVDKFEQVGGEGASE